MAKGRTNTGTDLAILIPVNSSLNLKGITVFEYFADCIILGTGVYALTDPYYGICPCEHGLTCTEVVGYSYGEVPQGMHGEYYILTLKQGQDANGAQRLANY